MTFIFKNKHIIFLFAVMLYSCSSNTSRRDIDYNEEFEKGKAALSKKKYIKAQDHFNTVVIGASHTELGDDALFYLGESFFLEKNHLLAISEYDSPLLLISMSERTKFGFSLIAIFSILNRWSIEDIACPFLCGGW